MEQIRNEQEIINDVNNEDMNDEKFEDVEEEIIRADDEAERTLSTFATALTILGFLAGIILIVASITKDNYTLLLGAMVSILGGIYGWAMLKVFVNVSMTLKEINRKIK